MTTTRDRRDEILGRYGEILSGLTIPLLGDTNSLGAVTIKPGNFVRNRNELTAEKVPGIILLDADEQRDNRLVQPPRGRTEARVPDAVMKMTPETYIVLDTRTVNNVNMGKDLNTARLAILAAVLFDKQLQEIVGNNGDICYDGAVTDLARNRVMKGQMGISITFRYPLIGQEYRGI